VKITEQDKRDIEQTTTLLRGVSEYLCMIWNRELKFDDNQAHHYSGLNKEDREIAEEKFVQIESIYVANEWLYRIIKENK
tara:strand:- start:878 stop:1117 length:240 start_codon:yes stop_codon:yes gene_type:complete